MNELIKTNSDDEKSWLKRIFSKDGWMNILTGIGTKSRDKRESTFFASKARMSQATLEAQFHQDDLTKTICQLPAKEMTRQWITINVPQSDDVEDDKDPAGEVMKSMRDLCFRKKAKDAIQWARLYGGSIIMLGADDGTDDVSLPLNEESIESFDWMTVFDRWDVDVNSYYTDPAHPKYNQPETYRLTNALSSGTTNRRTSTGETIKFTGNIVHETRVLRFDGAATSRRRMLENSGWSDSVIEAMREVIRDFNSSFSSLAHLMQDFSQGVFKIKGLASMLAQDEDDLVLKRLSILDMARSVGRAIPLDADGEEFERKATPTTGLDGIVDRQMMRVSSASRMPVTLLFGRSPAGMNSTGDSDIRLFYDNIKADQDDDLRDPVERVIHLLFITKDGPTDGVEPESWSMEFNSLWQETSKEKAETRDIVADSDKKYVDMGALDPAEVRKSRWGGDAYSPETTIIVDDGSGGETLATVNELSLTLERAARIGDIDMVNGARRALAKRLGIEEVADVTTEQLGETLKILRAREAEGAAQGRQDNLVEKPLQLGRRSAPNYRTAPELLRMPAKTLQELDDVNFNVCDNCGFEENGVCVLFDFAVDIDHVCDQWTDPEEISAIALDAQHRRRKLVVAGLLSEE